MCATLRSYIFQNYTHNLNQMASKSCTEWNQNIEARYIDVLSCVEPGATKYERPLALKQIFSWSEMTNLRTKQITIYLSIFYLQITNLLEHSS